MGKQGYRQGVAWLIMGTAVVGLAACNKPAASTAETAKPAEAAAKPASGMVDMSRGNPMGRKPGLWEITNTVDGASSPMKTRMCVDSTLGEKMSRMAGQMSTDIDCTQSDVRATPTGAVIDQVCKMKTTTLNSHIEITATGDDGFHQVINTRYEPAYMGRTESSVVMDGKWQGDCPAGMKPGDMQLPGGVTINMNTIADGMKKKP